jgi:hypothetical protein
MLRARATFGFSVFEAATPEPILGCMIKNGAATLRRRTINAGSGVG